MGMNNDFVCTWKFREFVPFAFHLAHPCGCILGCEAIPSLVADPAEDERGKNVCYCSSIHKYGIAGWQTKLLLHQGPIFLGTEVASWHIYARIYIVVALYMIMGLEVGRRNSSFINDRSSWGREVPNLLIITILLYMNMGLQVGRRSCSFINDRSFWGQEVASWHVCARMGVVVALYMIIGLQLCRRKYSFANDRSSWGRDVPN